MHLLLTLCLLLGVGTQLAVSQYNCVIRDCNCKVWNDCSTCTGRNCFCSCSPSDNATSTNELEAITQGMILSVYSSVSYVCVGLFVCGASW